MRRSRELHNRRRHCRKTAKKTLRASRHRAEQCVYESTGYGTGKSRIATWDEPENGSSKARPRSGTGRFARTSTRRRTLPSPGR
jgi:hypothetical protein